MSFSYRRSQLTAFARDLRQWSRDLELAVLFEPNHLVKPHVCNQQVNCDGRIFTAIGWAVAVNTHGGHLYKKDALQFNRDGHVQIGFAIGFCRAASGEHLACCFVCGKLNDAEWIRPASPNYYFINVSDIAGSVPYVELGDRIYPLLHLP